MSVQSIKTVTASHSWHTPGPASGRASASTGSPSRAVQVSGPGPTQQKFTSLLRPAVGGTWRLGGVNGHILPGPKGNPGNGPAGWQLDKTQGWIESAQERCSERSTFKQLKDFLCFTTSQPQAASCMCLALGQSQLCLGSVWGKADSGQLQSSRVFRIAFFLRERLCCKPLQNVPLPR